MYKFKSKMIMQGHINNYFVRKIFCQHQVTNPQLPRCLSVEALSTGLDNSVDFNHFIQIINKIFNFGLSKHWRHLRMCSQIFYFLIEVTNPKTSYLLIKKIIYFF